MKISKISKPTHGSAEWLAVRWRDENGLARISASVAAAVHGTHPYMTTADLVTELIAAEPPQPKDPNSAMLRGTVLEGPIREWSAQILGYGLHEPQEMYAYEEDGVRLIATIDAMNADGVVHEIKTRKKRWDGKMPDMWRWQGVQQAICTGTDKVIWCILDGDLDLKFYTQEVTSDEKRIHIEACRRFLSYVDMGMYPDDVVPSYDNIKDLHKESQGTTAQLPTEAKELVTMLQKMNQHIKSLTESASQMQAELCRLMGESQYAVIDGILVATWKPVTRNSFDQKAFEKEHPALYAKYKKATAYRQFKISKQGEEQ